MTIFRDVIKLICPVCGLNIEDEIHFLFYCPKYSSIRDDILSRIDQNPLLEGLNGVNR